jgi:hypothetical protein
MWEYRAAIVRIHDGDTLFLLIDQGLHGRQEEPIRLEHVSAPELSDPGGVETLAYVREWCDRLRAGLRWPLLVNTVPNTNPEPDERRTFVRFLGTIRDIAAFRNLNDDVRAFLATHPEWGSGM